MTYSLGYSACGTKWSHSRAPHLLLCWLPHSCRY